jgi:SAM-dependent methyltransferase
MIDIDEITSNLECKKPGFWQSVSSSDISYPEDGNINCFEIEESSFWFKHRNNCIVQAVRLYPPGGPIFDVGGGNGYVSLAIQGAGFESILLEPGYQGALNAQNRGLRSVICSTLENAFFEDNSIPAIGIFDVLEHLEDDIGFLSKIKEILVKNGLLYITVPAYNFLWSDEDDVGGHYRRYTIKSLRKKIERIGFEIELETYIFSLLPIPIYLARTIPYKLGRRNQGDITRMRREHSIRGSLVGQFLDKVFGMEIFALRKKEPFHLEGVALL